VSAKDTVSFLQFEISKDEFQSLPEDHQVLVAILCQAINEMQVFQRLFAMQHLSLSEAQPINSVRCP